jgi:hypothetical protein
LDEEVADNEEGIDDNTDAAVDDIATAEDIAAIVSYQVMGTWIYCWLYYIGG